MLVRLKPKIRVCPRGFSAAVAAVGYAKYCFIPLLLLDSLFHAPYILQLITCLHTAGACVMAKITFI